MSERKTPSKNEQPPTQKIPSLYHLKYLKIFQKHVKEKIFCKTENEDEVLHLQTPEKRTLEEREERQSQNRKIGLK